MRRPSSDDVLLSVVAAIIEATLIGRWLHRRVWRGLPS